jgi:hypothetical protein
VLWIDLAIALTPLLVLAGTCIGLWNRSRRLIREIGGLSIPTPPERS